MRASVSLLTLVLLLLLGQLTSFCFAQISSADFPATAPEIFQSGYFETVKMPAASLVCLRFASRGCQLDFVARGTSCTLYGLATAPNVAQVSVDGGRSKLLVLKSLNHETEGALFSGLADKTHHVTVKLVGSPDSFLVNRDRMLTLKGSQPELIPLSQAEPEAWGTQAYPVATAQGPSAYIVPEAKTLQLTKNQDGYPGLLRPDLYSDGSVICRATGSGVRAWMLLNRSDWQVMVDGVNQPIVTLPNQRTYGWVTLASGLDPTKEHTIVITEVVILENRFGPQALYALMFPDGALDTSAPPPARPVLMVVGHSIIEGRWLPYMTDIYYHGLGQAHGYAIAARGIRGCTFRKFNRDVPKYNAQSSEARRHEVVDAQPDICIVDSFATDTWNASGAVPPETTKSLQTALSNYLTLSLSQCPKTRFYVLNLLPNDRPIRLTQNDWNTAIKNAVNAVKSPRVHYVDQSAWIDWTVDTVDGLHPNVQGSQKIRQHLEAIVFPAGT